jgi:serine/threonine protein kinase
MRVPTPRHQPKQRNSYEIVEVNGSRETVYKKQKMIGSGTFASVFLCQKAKGKGQCAIKVIPKKRISKKPQIKNQVDLTSCTGRSTSTMDSSTSTSWR